jgi:nicotinamidase-related amidase
MSIVRLVEWNSTVLVVDVQEKLLPAIPGREALIRDVGFVLDVANLLKLPIFATEQYPKGLGPTHPEIARRLPTNIPAKTAFSCCGAPGLTADLRACGRKQIVVLGMETHVCVLHTVFDLLAEGMTVFVPVDGVQGRYPLDGGIALERMKAAGAILTTVDATAFEWLGGADHPSFKEVSRLVQQRMKAINDLNGANGAT